MSRPTMPTERTPTMCPPHARFADERGATAVEYAIMASLIAAVIVIAVGALGVNVTELFAAVPRF